MFQKAISWARSSEGRKLYRFMKRKRDIRARERMLIWEPGGRAVSWEGGNEREREMGRGENRKVQRDVLPGTPVL